MHSAFVLADLNRIRQISQICHARSQFLEEDFVENDDQILSAISAVEEEIFLSPQMREQILAKHPWSPISQIGKTFFQRSLSDSPETHLNSLRKATKEIRAGALLERLFWTIHEGVLYSRNSTIRMPLHYVRFRVWGPNFPSQWRRDLWTLSQSLNRLQCADVTEDRPDSMFVYTAGGDKRGTTSHCLDRCVWSDRGSHAHYHVFTGPAFLGVLEDLWTDQSEERGDRYFMAHDEESVSNSTERWNARLSEIGKTGRLTQIYLPAVVGSRKKIQLFRPEGQRLLHVIIREASRPIKQSENKHPSGLPLLEFKGNQVPDEKRFRNGVPHALISCPYLKAAGRYVGFNGNGKRRQQGYKLETWAINKAQLEDASTFLRQLKAVATKLDLIVVAFDAQTRKWRGLEELLALAKDKPNVAKRHHLRIYADTNFRSRWDDFFGWNESRSPDSSEEFAAEATALLGKYQSSKAEGARLVGCHPSHFSKLLKGTRKMKRQTFEKLQMELESIYGAKPEGAGVEKERIPIKVNETSPKSLIAAIQATHSENSSLELALLYRQCGWSVIPQKAGSKKPLIKWKQYQTKCPSEAEIKLWWKEHPSAGIALVAGPTSGVFVVDVDGEEAHQEFRKRVPELGTLLKVNSGSKDPYRYHLYFQHPVLRTKAKITPWHPALEFRGHGGLLILPPSQHASGRRYMWSPESEQWSGDLPPLPESIVQAIEANSSETAAVDGSEFAELNKELPLGNADDARLTTATRQFLSGEFANESGWNDRIFKTACELCGNEVPVETALTWIEAGARPRTKDDRDKLNATVKSAYSQQRTVF